MAELNHTIVWCSDRTTSATFLAEILGAPPPRTFYHFLVVDLANGVSLDFLERPGEISPQHYAFLVSDEEFDAALAVLKAKEIDLWADPMHKQPGINRSDGGRGVYFADPDGHMLELITKPYA